MFFIIISLLNNPLSTTYFYILTFSILINFLALKFHKKKPYFFLKSSFNDESIFCYLYSKKAIYIIKHQQGLDNYFEKIEFSESDTNTKLFTSSNNSELMPYLNKNKWGFKKGNNIIIDFIYDYVESDSFYDMRFSDEGISLVNKNNLYGYIDIKGNVIIDFQYKEGRRFEEGRAVVVNLENKYGVINKENKTIIDFKYEEIYEYDNDLYVVKYDGKVGIVNSLNKVVLDIIYSKIEDIESDRSIIIINEGDYNKYGYIDRKGEIIINPIYSCAYDFVLDYAVVEKFHEYELLSEAELKILYLKEDFDFEDSEDRKFGVIDKFGNEIIPFIFNEINIYELVNFDSLKILITGCIEENNWGIVSIGSKIKIMDESTLRSKSFDINEEEKLLIEFENYLKHNQFENLKYFESNNKFGYKDRNNEIIVQPIYESGYYFKNGLCIVIKNKKYGVINSKGEIIIDIKYEYIWLFDEWAVAKRLNKYFYLDENGCELANL